MSFITRNFKHCIKSPRTAWATIKAMRAYRKRMIWCEVCLNDAIDVHHCLPIHVRPDLAADPENFISVCKDCHLHIMHLGNYKWYLNNARSVADMIKRNLVTK